MFSKLARQVIFSVLVFFVMYPIGICKPSGNLTSIMLNTSFMAQEKHFLKKIKDIINLKASSNVLKECNTTKGKVLAELVKKYKEILKNMSNSGVPVKLRIKDFVRERKISGSFTTSSTNQRKNQISFKNQQFLTMDDSGIVHGEQFVAHANKNNTIFYVKPTAAQTVMVQSYHTKNYLAMDKHGHVYAKATPDHETLFHLRSEENHFVTLASYKYYLLCPFDMFLAVRNTGYMKSPHQSVPGQDSTQIILVPVK